MRPTLEQISNYALERVDREGLIKNKNDPDKFYIRNARRSSKKFSREITMFVCVKYYGYTSFELWNYFKVEPHSVNNKIWKVKNSKEKVEKAQELFHSLEIINKNNYIGQVSEEFSIISGELNKDIQKLNSFEIWLINRLYETNK